MIRTWPIAARLLTGILATAGLALPQAYTISAKPGAVNYIEGGVSVNGASVTASSLKALFLGQNDMLSTDLGKAEVLLSPGVFLRVGENSQVRMVSPSLVEMQVEIVSGEAMVEVDQAVQGSSTAVMDHGSSTVLSKTGLYRFTASGTPTLGVVEGKALVYFGPKKVEVGKGKQVLLTEELLLSKLDLSKADELYAWSNVRAQYDAAASYQGSKSVYNSGGYGYASGYQSAGLYWNNPFNSWMWLPGNGAFYSPFGWGFYGPGVVAFAPVVYGYAGGYGYGGYGYGSPYYGGFLPTRPVTGRPVPIPVNPSNPGVVGTVASSPVLYSAVRAQMVRSMQSTGANFRTASGGVAANLASGRTYANSAAAWRAAASSARSSSSSGSSGSSASSGGGWSGGGGSSSARSSAMSSGGGGHSTGGGGGRSK